MKKRIFLGALAIVLAFGFIGCDDGKEEQEDVGFTLKVNSLPDNQEGKIWGASLLGNTGEPVAIGMLNSKKVFEFYTPNEGDGMPIDFFSPFKTPGTYRLGLAVADISTFEYEEVYLYTRGTPTGTIKYAKNKHVTVNWNDFSIENTQSTVITITNKPSNANVIAVMDGDTQIALGIAFSVNVFTLYEPSTPPTVGPDYTKPWKGSGDYSIFLANAMTQQPVASYKETGGENTLYNFTEQEAITFDYNIDFVSASAP